VDADRALDWGLVGRVVDEDAAAAAHEVAAQLANGPATALAHASRLVRDGWDRSRAEAGAQETRTIADAVTTPEAQELIADFLNGCFRNRSVGVCGGPALFLSFWGPTSTKVAVGRLHVAAVLAADLEEGLGDLLQ